MGHGRRTVERPDEDDVDDADDVVVDQLRHGRHDLALEPVARKRDDDVLDRSHAGHVASSPTTYPMAAPYDPEGGAASPVGCD
jgi:hypothetical protein